MAKHLRRAILEHYKTQLKPLTAAGSVWISRGYPPSAARPCFTLADESESVEIMTIHPAPRPQQRSMVMVVTGWSIYDVNDPEKSEERLDTLALDIEQTLTKHASADDLQLIGTEKLLDEEDPKSSSVTLRFNIVYRTTERNPI